MEVYAIEIQMYTETKNNKKLKVWVLKFNFSILFLVLAFRGRLCAFSSVMFLTMSFNHHDEFVGGSVIEKVLNGNRISVFYIYNIWRNIALVPLGTFFYPHPCIHLIVVMEEFSFILKNNIRKKKLCYFMKALKWSPRHVISEYISNWHVRRTCVSGKHRKRNEWKKYRMINNFSLCSIGPWIIVLLIIV